MTTSSTGKKTGLLIGGIIVLAVAAYGGMRYMESRIAEEVRASIASLPPEYKLEVGDVRFSLLSNTLTVRNIQKDIHQDGVVFKGTIEEILVVKPNIDLLKPASKDNDNLPVADSLHVKNLAVKEPNTKFGLSMATLDMVNIRLDMKRFRHLTMEQGMPVPTGLSLAIMVADTSVKDIAASVEDETTPVSVTVKSINQKAYNKGASEGSSAEGFTVLVNKEPRGTVERIIGGRTNPLDDKSYLELEKMTAKAQTTTLTEEESLRALSLILTAPKPLLESFSLVNMAITAPEFPLTLGSLDFTNPSNSPLTSSLGFKNLVLPVAQIPGLEELSMMGYKALDISASTSISWPSANRLEMAVNVDAKDMAELRCAVNIETQAALFSTTALLDLEKNLTKSPPKLASLTLTLDDKGLIGRGASTAQMTAGLDPDAATALLQTMLKAIFADYMSPAKATERVNILMTFVNRPGKLTFKIEPATPLSQEQAANLTGDEEFIIIEAVPGPKTLKELMSK